MTGLIDQPGPSVPVEVAIVISGDVRDATTAYAAIPQVQVAVVELLKQRWPYLAVTLSQATVGEVGEDVPR